jgi:hypothetical protein
MQDNDSFEIKAKIMSLGSWNRPVMMYSPSNILTTGQPPPPPKMEIDPTYIALDFQLEGLDHSFCHLLVKREDVKRLNLTVGDSLSIRVAPAK